MFLYVLDAAQRAEALAFNNDPNGQYYDPNHDHLPAGYGATPIPVRAPAPYAYAGKWVLPTSLSSSPDYIVMINFLGTLPIADIVPSEAWPPEEDE